MVNGAEREVTFKGIQKLDAGSTKLTEVIVRTVSLCPAVDNDE